MSKSAKLRAEDWRSILQLVRECRELGDYRKLWRRHFIEQLCRRVGADLGYCGEMAGCTALTPRHLGVVVQGDESGFDRAIFEEQNAAFEKDPTVFWSVLKYFQRLIQQEGVCHSRQEIIADREWYRSADYQLIQRAFDVDHILWCFRTIPGTTGDEFSGVMLNRASGERDYTARERSIVREAHAALAPLIGGPLTRFSEPCPTDLAPRARQVLGCLLEGDGDKQIAARLGLSRFTVNEYTKLIFRHFGVSSRPELLARWIRRGFGNRSPLVP
jgi:DNA-binding CsgD family transcriptional regulator